MSNVFGDSTISNLISNGLRITYWDTTTAKSAKLKVYNYSDFTSVRKGDTVRSLIIALGQNHYEVIVNITNTNFQHNMLSFIESKSCSNYINTIFINNCTFKNNRNLEMFNSLIDIHLFFCKNKNTGITQAGSTTVLIQHSLFYNNKAEKSTSTPLINCVWLSAVDYSHNFSGRSNATLIINNSSFNKNEGAEMLYLFMVPEYSLGQPNSIYIIDTTFSFNTQNYQYLQFNKRVSIVHSNSGEVYLIGTVIFINNTYDVLLQANGAHIHLQGHITIWHNKINSVVYTTGNASLFLIEPIKINITNNIIRNEMFYHKITPGIIPACYFQFYENNNKSNKLYMITIANNTNTDMVFNQITGNINCEMLPGSVFYKYNPLQVYQQYIHFNNESEQLPVFDTGLLCYCDITGKHDCQINSLGPIYPGQTVPIGLKYNRNDKFVKLHPVSVEMYQSHLPSSHCKVASVSETFSFLQNTCTQINFTILSSNDKQCELFLNAKEHDYITILYIKLSNCPMGFVFNMGKCECDPSLNLITTQCNINDQTILRPANSWISAEYHHSYYICHNCPFNYCLSHSSSLNFSTPNLQCQFNRSNLLCGQCQQGLSVVFGSSHCQHCSNIHLLLILPIIIVGILLVLLLFLLNLTVTDGTINAFIMYVNIIGINSDVFFTDHVTTPAAYTFISLVNLDLGIKTCFYDGMDDYAKMWLQLTFPMYLIFIATSLIITSRYSTTVQRLTAHRALPVLATLFLLSYTKILHTVSSVLFFYSTITHLPSKHTTLVWSVDANIPLFGIRFTILFVVCLSLFLILLPFNAILLFTKTLSKFRLVSKFKPLLDAYQGPYKLNFYYWTGLQLLIRAVLFGIAALDKNINLIIGSVLFSIIIGLYGIAKPFKNNIKNYHEIVIIVNLQVLYIFTLSGLGVTAVNVMIAIAALHFTFIVTTNITTYRYGGVVRNKLHYYTSRMKSWFNRLHKKPSIAFERVMLCKIPEVTYNYHEYREPLVGIE